MTPGLAAVVMFITSPYSIKLSKRKVPALLAKSILPAISLHFLGISIAEGVFNQNVRFDVIGALLNTRLQYEDINTTYNVVKESLNQIFLYHICLIGLGMFLGWGAMRVIRATGLDTKVRLFRFSNKWYYIFSGECLDFPDVPGSHSDIDVKVVNLLCDIGGKQYIYVGFYSNYYLNSNGELESIQITSPLRRSIDKDRKQKSRYYRISSRYMVIPSKSIVNINMFYFSIEK